MVQLVECVMNQEWSDLEDINPKETKTSLSFSNQVLGACFKPYNALCNWHTKCGEFESSKPAGCSIYTSSCKSPFKKALFTSNYLTYQPFNKAIVKTILIVVGFTIGLKVYKIKTCKLEKPLCYQSCLMLQYTAIWIFFYFKYPFTTNCFLVTS